MDNALCCRQLFRRLWLRSATGVSSLAYEEQEMVDEAIRLKEKKILKKEI